MIGHQISRIRQFLHEDLWKIKLATLPKPQAFLYRQLRIWMIAISEFTKDKCAEKASALTYFSLLSIVPVMAMAFGIAQMFGLKEFIEDRLKGFFEENEEIFGIANEVKSGAESAADSTLYEKVSGFAENMLSTANGGVISGISAIFLIYAVARLLNNIELSFNHIWDSEKGRSLKRMVTDYMSIIFLGPLFLILSISITVFITNEFKRIELLGVLEPLVQLLPYTVIWLFLFLIYIIFPNTSVKLKPALIAGIIAGTAFQLAQYGWIKGQVFLSRYSEIYGAFAALPLLLMWLQLSWMILLFGAEIAFAIQNVDRWAYDNEKLRMNLRTRRTLALLVLKKVIRSFYDKDESTIFENLTSELAVPRRFVKDVVEDLESAHLLTPVLTHDDTEAYQPGLDVHKIDIQLVNERLDRLGLDNLSQVHGNEGYDELMDLQEQLQVELKSSSYNKKLLDL